MGLFKKIITWAVGNYPTLSEPWDGQPMRVQPANAYITPEATRPAETDNWVYGNIIDNLNATADALAATYAKNWSPSAAISFPGGNSVLKVSAAKDGNDLGNNNWFAWTAGTVTTSANALAVQFSRNGGQEFFDTSFPTAFRTASSSCQIAGVYGDSNGNAICILPFGALNADASIYSYTSGAWLISTPFNATALGGGPTTSIGMDGYWDQANVQFILNAHGFGIGAVTYLAVYPIAISPTNAPASSPPAGVGNVASTLFVHNDTCGIQLPKTQTSTGWAYVWRYTNPTVTGSHTYPAFGIAATDVCTAADWSPVDGFMVSVWDGTNTYFMQSTLGSNGNAWARASVGIPAIHITGLVCIGGYTWVATESTGTIFFSTDFGATWQRGGMTLDYALGGGLVRNWDGTQALDFGNSNVLGVGFITG